jgi:ABC-type multidrug transport system fused ATPase/permease subunit
MNDIRFGNEPFFMTPSFFSIFFIIVFLLIIGVILFTIISGLTEWTKNNSKPIVTSQVKVVSKRQKQHVHRHGTANRNISSRTTMSTTYYITFEFESGDRQEFKISDKEFGLISENDIGKLRFQGTRYLEFEREK